TNADAKVTPRSVATDNIETKGLDGGQFALRRIEIGPTALASPISWEDQLGICSIPCQPQRLSRRRILSAIGRILCDLQPFHVLRNDRELTVWRIAGTRLRNIDLSYHSGEIG